MRKLSLLGVVAALATSSVAGAQIVQSAAPAAGSTTIDFNSLAAFTNIMNQFAGLGMTVSSSCFMSNTGNYNAFFNNDPMQASNFDQFGTDCHGGGSYPNVTFLFTQAIHSFGFNGISNGFIQLTDAHGAINVFAPVTNPGNFVGFTDVSGTNFVTVSASANNAFVLDNVSFDNVTSTPEPSSVVLLVTGIAGLGTVARRRRAKA